MKRNVAAWVGLVALLGLSACSAVSEDVRNDVQTAVALELIPDTIVESFMDGDAAAQGFVEQMHELAAELTSAIIDDGMCGSSAYEAGLAGSPEVLAAHENGCAEYQRLTT